MQVMIPFFARGREAPFVQSGACSARGDAFFMGQGFSAGGHASFVKGDAPSARDKTSSDRGYASSARGPAPLSARGYAPSNIALIKYAGKKDSSGNLPLNSSLSYTLDHLKSVVEISSLAGPVPGGVASHRWEALKGEGFFPLELSKKSVQKFLNFFEELRGVFQIPVGGFLLRSGNHFPFACGAASSASSFCALTRAAYQLALRHRGGGGKGRWSLSEGELSAISRRGSGSSCRSFFSPWVLWEGERAVKAPVTAFPSLIHHLVVCGEGQKPLSSSEAHVRILSSPFFKGRQGKAGARLALLLQALNDRRWRRVFELSWEEFEDLHRLYETSVPPVFYRSEASHKVLAFLKDFWRGQGTGPVVTMDAGSAVHLLYRPDQGDMARDIHSRLIQMDSRLRILSSS